MHIIVTVTVKYLSITPSFHLLFFLNVNMSIQMKKLLSAIFHLVTEKCLFQFYIFLFI